MGHLDADQWRAYLWRGDPADPRDVLARLTRRAILPRHLQATATRLSRRRRRPRWAVVRRIGRIIDRRCRPASRWAPLATALITGADQAAARPPRPNMCLYCWRPVFGRRRLRQQTCQDHQAPLIGRGPGYRSGYDQIRRMRLWSSIYHGMPLHHYVASLVMPIGRAAGDALPESPAAADILAAFPRLHDWWIRRHIPIPADMIDIAIGLLGDDIDEQVLRLEMGVIDMLRYRLLLTQAEAWLTTVSEYRDWYQRARARGGRPVSVSDQAVAEAAKLIDGGMSLRAAAQAVGITRSTLSRRLRASA